MGVLRLVNWKTTSAALGYLVCNIAGFFYPAMAGLCDVLDKLFIAGGLIVAADAARVQNVVNAVDQVVRAAKVNLVKDGSGAVEPVQ